VYIIANNGFKEPQKRVSRAEVKKKEKTSVVHSVLWKKVTCRVEL
jgi:hypothetical protein